MSEPAYNPTISRNSRAWVRLTGIRDASGRKLIADHPQDVVCREFSHDRYTTDMDTLEDYARIRGRFAEALRLVAV